MKSYEFFIQTRKEDIDFINKIMEAYEGIGVVRTNDPKKGLITIITTTDFKETAKEIIIDLGKNYVQLEILREGLWNGNL
ncbi:MAG: DUF4911 domain-containing protein [Fusobacterium sp. JB021]|nr:DUF4911 domain-containing protein [Fusobacterium sp. JB020]MDP0494322.1 DUF4911 domain-containing protein [Fusobacterium sp. JB021]MDP0506309.1 DUF4911 domain-containing protein [Fusobacterium sp. JB019]